MEKNLNANQIKLIAIVAMTIDHVTWVFYVYYPAHLVIIGIIRIALHGNISIIF